MGDRRRSRELALQALFSLDLKGETDPSKSLKDFAKTHEEELTPAVEPFFTELVAGVLAHLKRIDTLLEESSKNWKLSRMSGVDRNIMRIAVFEMLVKDDIPSSVSINEAVDIGKRFGTRDSGGFINVVLDRIRTRENLN